MNDNFLEVQNTWTTEYLESEGILNKVVILKLQWGKPIRFDFVWGTKTTTIVVKKSINRSSIVGTINFSLIGRTANVKYEEFISSASDNEIILGDDGKLYVKPQPEPEFPSAVLVATNW